MKYLIIFSFLSIFLTGCKHVFHIGDILDGPGMVYDPDSFPQDPTQVVDSVLEEVNEPDSTAKSNHQPNP